MSRRNDPFNDFTYDRGNYHYTRGINNEKEKYYALKRQMLEEKLEEESKKQREEERKQREETFKLLEYYRAQMEELNKAKETATDQSQSASVIKGSVDVRSPITNQHSQTFLENARLIIKSNTSGEPQN